MEPVFRCRQSVTHCAVLTMWNSSTLQFLQTSSKEVWDCLLAPDFGLRNTFALLGTDSLYLLYKAAFSINGKNKIQDQEYKFLKNWYLCFLRPAYEVVPSPRSAASLVMFHDDGLGDSVFCEQLEGRLFFYLWIFRLTERELRTQFECPVAFLLPLRVTLYLERQLYILRKESKHYWHPLGQINIAGPLEESISLMQKLA